MKKLSVLFITLILAFALSACGRNTMDNNSLANDANSLKDDASSLISDLTPSDNNSQDNKSTKITREKALKIALEKAGAKESDIRDLDIELDTENGVTVWDVDFEYNNIEYSYEINAQTGAIAKTEREHND